jgi:hypothetical protein
VASLHASLILVIALPEAEDNIDPGSFRWIACHAGVRFVRLRRSSVMASASGKRTMTGMQACGFGAGFAVNAKRHSQFCPTGWFRLGTTACVVDSRPVNGSLLATLRNRQRLTAKIRHACPIHPHCADGYKGEC